MEDAKNTVNKWLITITVMLPAIMEIIDTSVANVALPHMQGSLNAGTDEITWVLTSYLVSNAVVLPMTGWLASVFGRKRFLMACIVLFTLASLLCGAAPNLATLIFFRVLQGAAGGALIPMSQAILMETFPPAEQGMAMAIFGVGTMFGPIIGPALGGWITDNLSWRWIFYINIPVGIVAIVMATFFIFDPDYIKKKRMAIDYWGLALLIIGLGALQIVLDKGQQEDWFNSPFILVSAVISALSLVALVYVELNHPHPIVNLRLFRNVSFTCGNLIMFAVGFCLYSSIMLIPLFLQTLMGYSATMAGMVLAPGGVATLICMPFVGAAIQKYDGRKIVFLGLVISALSMFIMQRFTLQAAYGDFVWPRIVLGVGLAMTFVPLTTLTLSSIHKAEMGNATGIFSLLRNVGGSVGIAISATLLQRYAQFYQTSLVAHVTPYSLTAQSWLAKVQGGLVTRGVELQVAGKGALALLYGTVQRQAYMLAYNRIFFMVGLAFLVIVPLLLMLKKGAPGSAPAAH